MEHEVLANQLLAQQNRILIFGAGVIGSAYAIKFIEAGIVNTKSWRCY